MNRQYTTLVAYQTFALPKDKAESYIRRETANRYRVCCAQINRGECTVDEAIASFPMPS